MANQFLPTTQQIRLDKLNSNRSDFNVNLRNYLNILSITLNNKESGYYSQEEILNGQLFFPDYTNYVSSTTGNLDYRPIYRKTIDTGALANAGTTTIAHGITFYPALPASTTFRLTRLYGAATDPTNHTMIPLPYSSPTLNENVSVYADGTNIYITTGINRTSFTKSQIVIEFIKG